MLGRIGMKRKLGYVAGCLLLFFAMGSQVRAAETEGAAEKRSMETTEGVAEKGRMETTEGVAEKGRMETTEDAVAKEGTEASESVAEATLEQITKDTGMKEAPDAGSSTIEELKAGTAVIVESTEKSWSKIQYKGKEGYIPSGALGSYDAGQVESLDQEFQEVEEENQRIVDEYELTQKEKHSSMVWGIVIAVLVAGIFAVGIISALKQNKEREKQ